MQIGTLAFKYWIEALFGVTLALITWGYKRLWKRTRAVMGGVQALLRDRIIQAYNYYRDKGYCPIYALENIHALHREYAALGGNGAISKLVKELEDMPRKKKEEAKQ